MPNRVKAWYDRKWVMRTLAILTLVSAPFREDIREAVKGLGVMLSDRLFDFLLAGGVVGLLVVLMLKSDRAARACEDLREQMKEHLAKHRKQLQKDLASLVDSKLKPITDGIGTLQSNVAALNSRLQALESRITALESRIAGLKKKNE
jgi:polyhydroxyalkanoate synthesis regulator phasin